MNRPRLSFRKQFLILLTAILPALAVPAADHAESPALAIANAPTTGGRDISDLFVFRSPSNPKNTVFVMTTNPFAGTDSPTTFDSRVDYFFNIDTDGDVKEDIVFRVRFTPPRRRTGRQGVQMKGWFVDSELNLGTYALTGENAPIYVEIENEKPPLPPTTIEEVGTFRAALQDDPFFFDALGFMDLVEDGVLDGVGFPRKAEQARNFFGPTRECQGPNVLAIVIEIPTLILGKPDQEIGVWGSTEFDGEQADRMGFPLINTALIAPVPRVDPLNVFETNRTDRRDEYNATHPIDDRRLFRTDMLDILENFYGRPEGNGLGQSGGLADLLLPDVLPFQLGNPNGFDKLNGRRLDDDVVDVEVTLLSGGAITSDNVDNDSRFTRDFPYIGEPNRRAQGPNTN